MSRFFWRVLVVSIGLWSCQNVHADDSYAYSESISGQIIKASLQEGNNKWPTTPSSSNLRSFDLFADVLVWSLQESGTENWAQTYSPKSSKEKIDILQVEFPLDVGLRIGVGNLLKHDKWDLQLSYTWFRTQGKDHISTSDKIASSFLGNFFIDNSFGISDSGPTYHEAAIDWTICFNVFDWELGRKYWVSKALLLHPFIGLKGGWIHQRIHSNWKNPEDPYLFLNPFNSAVEIIKNNFWGIGPSTGLHTVWELASFSRNAFSLFSDFSGALMWGHWTFDDVYKNDISEKVSIDLPSINGASFMLSAFSGLEWNAKFHRDRLCFSIRCGLEMQFWLDQLQFYSFNAGRLVNVVTLQGGTIDFRFDF